MKTLKNKQFGFFDPITGLTLFLIFGLTTVAVNPAKPHESNQTTACVEKSICDMQEKS
ncbi:MAG: hypothetical protein OEY09_05105 [Gammaproteobacteria bacterium]|nr:hypothetical protein [Gammaproteobacteria bacterium]